MYSYVVIGENPIIDNGVINQGIAGTKPHPKTYIFMMVGLGPIKIKIENCGSFYINKPSGLLV